MTKLNERGIYPMESISQFNHLKKEFDSISLNIYIITSYLNVIDLVKEIPEEILDIITDPELLDLVNLVSEKLSILKDVLNKVNPKLKQRLYKERSSIVKEDEPYAGFIVDEKPLTGATLNKEINETFNKELFLDLHQDNPPKPIKRRKDIPYKGECKCCGAPNNYLYHNDGINQYLCKWCNQTFSSNTKFYDELGYYCPHCNNKLGIHHDRESYLLYKCPNYKCPYYLNALDKQLKGDKSIKTAFDKDKLHYTYRSFKFDFKDVNHNDKITFSSKIRLDRAHHSPQTIGTILTLYVNYGLSSRKVASLMHDLFAVSISHQTVMNYAEAAASVIQDLIINYKYNLGNVLSGDETYIKILASTYYIFFFSDPKSKIITSWKIYEHRDTKAAIESLLMSFNKYEKIPEDLLIITDGNPIYNAAQIFLDMNDIHFNLQQVIGLSNKDETSTKYRPYKQVEERLNRTYKQNYYGTNGYNSIKGAQAYMILYVCFFNFLRTHSSLGYKTPVEIKDLDDYDFMYDKWIHLINLSANNYVT